MASAVGVQRAATAAGSSGFFRAFLHWAKYGELTYWPVLRAFPPDQAMNRLRAYRREEREACRPWFTIAWVGVVLAPLVWGLLRMYGLVSHVSLILFMVPGWVLQYVLQRRIRQRVEAKVTAELADGRVWTCVECGYDLRASPGPLCPECGSDIRVPPGDG